MAKHLNGTIGEMDYDNLISGMIPPVKVASGTIPAQSEDTEFKRGTVMCLGEDGNLSVADGSATPSCILTDTETVGTEAAVVPVYVMGCFNPAALIVGDGYELAQSDIDALRTNGIYLSDILD